MRKYKIISRSKTFIILLATISLCVVFIVFSKESFSGALSGLKYSLAVLIPSLFPFMVLSSFIIKSGMLLPFLKYFNKISYKIFNISPFGFLAFLLSMIGGYPIGAKCVSDLMESSLVSHNEAKKLILYCFGAGPGFLITFIGTNTLFDKKMGYILFASQLISMIVIALSCRNLYKEEKTERKYDFNKCAYTQALVESTAHAAITSLNMCALVMFFSSLVSIISKVFSNKYICLFTVSFLEITNGVNLNKNSPLIIPAFLTGFGGLCVHFQVFKILPDNLEFSKSLFFIIRIVQGILNAFFTYIFLILFPSTEQAVHLISEITPRVSQNSVLCGGVLMICSICFLLSLRKN